MNKSISYCEKALHGIKSYITAHRIELVTCIITGLLSYMFVFTNKFVNMDEASCLFGKGVTISSGRWGLELLSFIIPDYSMPWLHGITTLALFSLCVCIIIDLFNIKDNILKALLSAVIISFPSLMAVFGFMFTSSSYAVSFLLTVGAVALANKNKFLYCAVAVVLLVFSLSIYQAYITVAASLMLVLLACCELDVKKTLLCGLKFSGVLVSSVVIYFIITLVVISTQKVSFNNYAVAQISHAYSITTGLKAVYANFVKIFINGNFGIVNTTLSKIMHIICLVVVLASIAVVQIKSKNKAKAALSWAILALLPLAVNFFSMLNSFIHILMVYGFISVYVLAAVTMQRLKDQNRLGIMRDIVCVGMALIAASNIYVSNREYLKLNNTYENAYSFYTSLTAQIKSTEGFEEGCKVALIGESEQLLYKSEDFPDLGIYGMEQTLYNISNRESFIKYYVGFNPEFATYEEKEQIKQTEAYKNMAVYPYYGSVQKIDGFIVVKLSEE